MEEVYAAMLLHKARKEINEKTIKSVLEAAGIKVNEAKIKALIASLEGVDIDAAIKEAAIAPVAATSSEHHAKKEEAREEKKDEGKSQEDAAAGLGALFG